MKQKTLLSVIMTLLCAMSFAEAPETTPVYPYNPNATFQLYPTTNIWTFLKLDTSTGEIWIVQFSTKLHENVFEYPLSTENQNEVGIPTQSGRYILYPTQNIYNYIMLDQINGRTWQVQWSINKESRFVRRIYKSYQ